MEAELHKHAANEVRRKMLRSLMPDFSIIVQNPRQQTLLVLFASHCVYQQSSVWVKSKHGIFLLSTYQENILEAKP